MRHVVRYVQQLAAHYAHPVKRNLSICFWTMLLSRMCISILLPSLFPFVAALDSDGNGEAFYGTLVSLFNLAQLLASPCDHSREVFA